MYSWWLMPLTLFTKAMCHSYMRSCLFNFFLLFHMGEKYNFLFFAIALYFFCLSISHTHIETSMTTQNILLKFSFNENWWFLGSHILYLSPLLLYSHWQSTVSIIFLSWPHKSSWKTMRHTTKRKKIEWVGHKKSRKIKGTVRQICWQWHKENEQGKIMRVKQHQGLFYKSNTLITKYNKF